MKLGVLMDSRCVVIIEQTDFRGRLWLVGWTRVLLFSDGDLSWGDRDRDQEGVEDGTGLAVNEGL
jgi:hypothetical protein